MAVQNFDKALEIDPSNTLTLLNKAEALNKDRLFARAL
jgi:Tfp pilus assembly protein PilF